MEALLNQTSSDSVSYMSLERMRYLTEKYLSPVKEFPEYWVVGLLNVYQADILGGSGSQQGVPMIGCEFLNSVRKGAEQRMEDDILLWPSFCVVTGDDDREVP